MTATSAVMTIWGVRGAVDCNRTGPRVRTRLRMTATPAQPADLRFGAERPLLAIGLVLVAVALFSVMDAMSKVLAARLDPIEIVWGRYLVMVGILAPLALRRPRLLVASRPALQDRKSVV